MHAAFALKGKAVQRVAVPAVFRIQRIYGVQQAHAPGCIVGGRLAGQHDGVHGVFVPHMAAGQIAVAFLKTEEVALHVPFGFQQTDLLADELEAGQGAAQFHTIFGCNGRCHIGGNNGGHGHRMGGHGAVGLAYPADVIQQQHTHLVAGDQPVATLPVRHSGTHPVTVGVGAEHQIGVHGIAQLQAGFHGLPDLGVGVRTGGKVSVRLFLFGNNGHLGHAHPVQQHFYRLQTAAVQWRVDQLQAGYIIARAQCQYGVHKVGQAPVVDGHDAAIGNCLVIIRQSGAVEVIVPANGIQHLVGCFQGNLAAVGAVDLVAVVLGGVMAGCYADACAAAQVPYRPGQGRGGFQAGIEIGGDAVGGQHPGCFPAEQFAFVAAVMGKGYLFGQTGSVEVIGQALGGPADGVQVHPVGAGADDAPQAAGAELQVPVKTVADGGFVPGNGLQFGDKVGILHGTGKPEVQFFLILHRAKLLLIE